ncbi:hypothetical protein ACP4OV_009355 [Aristida adscensionis]
MAINAIQAGGDGVQGVPQSVAVLVVGWHDDKQRRWR